MKLYWRYKKDGKWTWKAATWDKITHIVDMDPDNDLSWTEEEE